ncbi:hypothetical protein [Noviherbaspirillum massiliense]|uniref:hypothetical protein n=1 Tax=Noviherbaspirillum massiliense TaxID=1465823 RepID=UPI0002D478A2|nr:hypothetical protein [Noviherbaspirillum massiliense]
MSLLDASPFLRRVLLADAAASAATGLLMALGAGPLSSWLGLPEGLLRYAGLVLLPFAAFVGYVGTRQQVSRAAVWTIIVANAVWAIESIMLLVLGWVAPNALGHAFVIAQALAVGVLAELGYFGVRRSALLPA